MPYNPQSRNNLIPGGVAEYGEPKDQKIQPVVTRTAKAGLKDRVKDAGWKSLSDFLEAVGRGLVEVPRKSG